jgi:transcriptional regulator with XRE-family HTH domain
LGEVTKAGVIFGARLRELRQNRGLTQVVLAEVTGFPQSHISLMERGEKLPQLVTLIRLAVALDCKLTALVSVFDKANLRSMLPK